MDSDRVETVSYDYGSIKIIFNGNIKVYYNAGNHENVVIVISVFTL